jgi:hypothetical protein
MKKNDGGQAFPRSSGLPGMSLRDWFAGQALTGFAANTVDDKYTAQLAKSAYAIADAMLAERAKP